MMSRMAPIIGAHQAAIVVHMKIQIAVEDQTLSRRIM